MTFLSDPLFYLAILATALVGTLILLVLEHIIFHAFLRAGRQLRNEEKRKR